MTEQEKIFQDTLLSNNPALINFLVSVEYIKRNQIWMVELDPSQPGDILGELRLALPNNFTITSISATTMENAIIYVKGQARVVSGPSTRCNSGYSTSTEES